MPGTMLSPLCVCSNLVFKQHNEVGIIINSILVMDKQRLIAVNGLVQSYIAIKG